MLGAGARNRDTRNLGKPVVAEKLFRIAEGRGKVARFLIVACRQSIRVGTGKVAPWGLDDQGR